MHFQMNSPQKGGTQVVRILFSGTSQSTCHNLLPYILSHSAELSIKYAHSPSEVTIIPMAHKNQ